MKMTKRILTNVAIPVVILGLGELANYVTGASVGGWVSWVCFMYWVVS